MKTVMKKMFSLLLVAVLLVGIMPFQAFADDGENDDGSTTFTVEFQIQFPGEDLEVIQHTHPGHTYTVRDFLDYYKPGWSNTYEIDQVWIDNNQVNESTPTANDRNTALGVILKPIVTHQHSFGEWDLTTPATCEGQGLETRNCTDSNCDAFETRTVNALGHDYGDWRTVTPATCTTDGSKNRICSRNASHIETGVISAGHNYNTNDFCENCFAHKGCGKVACDCVVTVTLVDEHNDNRTVQSKPGETVSLASDPMPVSGYSFRGWKLNGTGGYLSSYEIPGTARNGDTITIKAMWEQTTSLPTYTLNVYARLKIGGVERDVKLIHSKSGMLKNDEILEYLENTNIKTLLENKIEDDFDGYTWSGHFYNASGNKAAVDNITTVDGSKSVYINLNTSQDKVLVYVYTDADCEDYEYLYEMDGYKANSVKSTITSSEVRSFLREKFGSGITIKMFDKDGFNGYWRGKSGTDTSYINVEKGTTEVHVRLYKPEGSSSSKADSSNPKTGDMIFAPVIVLGTSVSALAALFYLNKKRAY